MKANVQPWFAGMAVRGWLLWWTLMRSTPEAMLTFDLRVGL
jgi:hypothetical protein